MDSLEAIQKRVKELKEQEPTLIANVHRVQGAIAVLEELINTLTKEDADENPDG